MASNESPTPPIPSFVLGDRVELCGLKNSPQLNRRVGTIDGGILDNGRYPVMLVAFANEQQERMAVKPENLKAMGGRPCLHCINCVNFFSVLTVCGNCHMASYCSQDCQKAHWHRAHKENCQLLKQARKAKHDDAKLPSDPMQRIYARVCRGRRWMEMRKHDHAEAEYKGILQESLFEQCPNSMKGKVYVSLADAIVGQDERPAKESDAIAILRKAVSLPQSTPEGKKYLTDTYYKLGLLLYKIQDIDGAEQAVKAAIENGDGLYMSVQVLQQELQMLKKAKRDLAKKEKKKSRKGKKGRACASKK